MGYESITSEPLPEQRQAQPGPSSEQKPGAIPDASAEKIADYLLRIEDGFSENLQNPEYGTPEERMGVMRTIQTLLEKDPTKKETLSGNEMRANETLRIEFENEGEKTIVGYQKSGHGESVANKNGDKCLWDDEKQEYVATGESVTSAFKKAVRKWGSEPFKSMYAEAMISKFKIPAEEQEAFKASLDKEAFGSRIDIDPPGSAIREMAAFVLSQKLKIDRVPPTVCKPVKDEQGKIKDFVSIQAAVESKDPTDPPRMLTVEEMQTLMYTPPDEWAKNLKMSPEKVQKLKKSIIQLACFHWAIGALDGHPENVILNDEGLQSIDNGLCFGASRGIEVLDGVKKRLGEEERVDSTKDLRSLRSFPLEVLLSNKELMLDPESRAQFKALYDEVLKNGNETRSMENLFKALFPHRRMAKEEMKQFLLRIRHLADQGRPSETEEIAPVSVVHIMGMAQAA